MSFCLQDNSSGGREKGLDKQEPSALWLKGKIGQGGEEGERERWMVSSYKHWRPGINSGFGCRDHTLLCCVEADVDLVFGDNLAT
jgi:hypothetical protein